MFDKVRFIMKPTIFINVFRYLRSMYICAHGLGFSGSFYASCEHHTSCAQTKNNSRNNKMKTRFFFQRSFMKASVESENVL